MWTQSIDEELKPGCHLVYESHASFIRWPCMAVSHWSHEPKTFVKDIKAPPLRTLCECPTWHGL